MSNTGTYPPTVESVKELATKIREAVGLNIFVELTGMTEPTVRKWLQGEGTYSHITLCVLVFQLEQLLKHVDTPQKFVALCEQREKRIVEIRQLFEESLVAA